MAKTSRTYRLHVLQAISVVPKQALRDELFEEYIASKNPEDFVKVLIDVIAELAIPPPKPPT